MRKIQQIVTIILFIAIQFIFFFPSNAQIDTIPGLVLWLSADSGVVKDSNNNVSEWHDISGNGIIFSQNNPALCPKFIENIDSLNFKPIIKFNQNLLTNFNNITLGTIFIFSNYDSTKFIEYSGLFSRASITAPDFLLVGNKNTTTFYSSIITNNLFINGLHNNDFSPLPKFKIIKGILNPAISWDDWGIGMDRSTISSYWLGNVGEIIGFNRQLSNLESNLIETYLMDKYAPPVVLPADTVLASLCPFAIVPHGYFTSYQWNTGSTNDTLVVTQSGKYIVTATDIFGRSSIDSISVQFPIQPFQNSYFLCFQDSIVLATNLSTTDYHFIWQNGDTNSYFIVHSPGLYFVHITDSLGCTYFSDTITVQNDTFHLQNALNDSLFICLGDTLKTNPIAAIDYLWSNSETTPYILPQTSQWYFVTLSNANNCKLIDSCYVTIKGIKPQPSIYKNNLCTNSPTLYTGNSTGNIQQWEWTFQDSIIQQGQQTNFLYQQAGIYQTMLHVIDSNTCEGFIISIDTIYTAPRAAFIYNSGCSGQYSIFESLSISQDSITGYYWNINNQDYQGAILNLNLNPSPYLIHHWITTKHGCSDSLVQEINILNQTSVIPADANFPTNGMNITIQNVDFSWNNHQQLSLIELSYQHDFLNIAFRSSPSYANNLTISSILSDTTIYWRIWTYNACGDSISSPNYYFSNYKSSYFNGLSLWLSADSGVVKDSNNNVSEWHDISGNGIIFSQNNPALCPKFIENIDSLNFKPIIKFNQNLLTNFNNITLGTIFIFSNYDSTKFIEYSGLFSRASITAPDFLLVGNKNTTTFYSSIITNNLFINGLHSNDFSLLPKFKIIKGILNPAISWDDWGIGMDRSTISSYWLGNVGEIIGFNRQLSNLESNLIETYLMDKYAPPVLLPADTVLTSLCTFAIVPHGYFTSYQWNTGSTNDTLLVTQSGKYIVTATDIFGRMSKDSITVTFPSTNIPDTIFVCHGDSVLLTSSLGNIVDYQWSNGSNKNYAYVKNEGWYYITMTDLQACSNVDSFFVKIDSLSTWSLFNQDSIILCKGNIIEIASTPYNLTSYFWSPTNDHTSTTVIDQSDWYSVQVQDINQCSRKDSMYVTVSGIAPVANFTFSHTCLGQNTLFTDQSISLDTSHIHSWQWIINDDTLSSQNPTYTFPNSGIFPVKLTIQTSQGCEQFLTQNVQVFPLPQPYFNVIYQCSNHQSFFSSQTTIQEGQIAGLTWLWGDGSFSFDTDTVHIYTHPDIYQVTLIAESDEGCIDSISKNIEIKPSPVAGFDVSPSCNNNPTFFADTSHTLNINPILQWQWSLGDGQTSTSQHPSHTYTNEGNYNVKLYIKTLNGCFDSITQTIAVSSKPHANFNVDSACVGQALQITNLSTISNGQIIDWKWYAHNHYFSNEQNPIFYPSNTNEIPITLIITSSTHCTDTAVKYIHVYPKPILHFELNPTYGAVPLTVHFENMSELGTSYWNFGDGSFSTLTQPTHTYQDTGIFVVWLTQTSIHGCIDSIAKSVLVVPNLTDLAIEKIQYSKNSSFITVTVLLSNLGTLPIENPVLNLIINGKTTISEIVYDTLFSGNKRYYTFNSLIPVTDNEINYICVNGEISNNVIEVNYENNENCISFISEEQILNTYPNPINTNLIVLVQMEEEQTVDFEIFEVSGKILVSKKIKLLNGLNKINIELSQLSCGVYLYQVKTKKHTFVHKFIKN